VGACLVSPVHATGVILTLAVLRNVYTSFGGLLMALHGPYKKLTSLRVDYVYLLVKK
jgi:hypothetical protein